MHQEKINVADATRDVGKKLCDLVKLAKAQVVKGKVDFSDVTNDLNAILTDLVPAVAECHNIPDEEKADMDSFLNAAFLDAKDLTIVLVS